MRIAYNRWDVNDMTMIEEGGIGYKVVSAIYEHYKKVPSL